MSAMTSMTGSGTDDLMSRRQVAYVFGVSLPAVAKWARCGLLLEVRNEVGRPRYRCADVEELRHTGIRRRLRGPTATS
jgi:predicted site-specific integrase-resolvase